MTIIKLPDEGDTYTGHVEKCEEVAGNFGQQVKFVFANGDTLFLPQTSAANQLLRAGFDGGNDDEHGEPTPDYEAVAGNTLTFARTPNKKKGARPYWDVSVATPASARPKPAPKRLTHAEALAPTAPGHPADVPPVDDADAPPEALGYRPAIGAHLTDEVPPTGQSEGTVAIPGAVAARMALYFDVAREVIAFQCAHGVPVSDRIPYDMASVNAMTFSIVGGR